MKFRLIDSGWEGELSYHLNMASDDLWIVCPFIKRSVVQRLIAGRRDRIRVITRFDLDCFDRGVSDLSALRLLVGKGAEVRGVRHVHAKLFGFGDVAVIAGSANLTEAAMNRNAEFGFAASEPNVVSEARQYFERNWKLAGANVRESDLDNWEAVLAPRRMGGARMLVDRLPDFGTDLSTRQGRTAQRRSNDGFTNRAFVKFFGESENRAPRTMAMREEVVRSGSHWAFTYPRNKRPRQVDDGDVMFMARMVDQPNDYLVYGDAVARRYRDGADDAADAEIERRPWKAKWPHYIRVTRPRILNGVVENGVSLNRLMAELGADAFASTQRNMAVKAGNTTPSRALMQKAHIQLSAEAHAWLRSELDAALALHGHLDLADPAFDWPDPNRFSVLA
ncbi:MAG: phospholipase D family protein [Proteobacteria bacterium]|nr:phospholipase D family protein [Pseudomonadota bacterium]